MVKIKSTHSEKTTNTQPTQPTQPNTQPPHNQTQPTHNHNPTTTTHLHTSSRNHRTQTVCPTKFHPPFQPQYEHCGNTHAQWHLHGPNHGLLSTMDEQRTQNTPRWPINNRTVHTSTWVSIDVVLVVLSHGIGCNNCCNTFPNNRCSDG